MFEKAILEQIDWLDFGEEGRQLLFHEGKNELSSVSWAQPNQSREGDDVPIFFLGLTISFYKVRRDLLKEAQEWKMKSSHDFELLLPVYMLTKTCVRIRKQHYTQAHGVPQGGSLSLALLNI